MSDSVVSVWCVQRVYSLAVGSALYRSCIDMCDVMCVGLIGEEISFPDGFELIWYYYCGAQSVTGL